MINLFLDNIKSKLHNANPHHSSKITRPGVRQLLDFARSNVWALYWNNILLQITNKYDLPILERTKLITHFMHAHYSTHFHPNFGTNKSFLKLTCYTTVSAETDNTKMMRRTLEDVAKMAIEWNLLGSRA